MAKLIAQDKSPAEIQDTLDQTIVKMDNNPDIAPQLNRLYAIGVTKGEAAAYFLDPSHTEQYLTKRVSAASLAASSERAGFAQLSVNQAENLASLGVTDSQGQQGFSSLGLQKSLLEQNAGDGNAISTDTALAAQFAGDANAIRTLDRRKQERSSKFAGGGSFSDPNKSGQSGVGSNF